tara:strand:+ start:1326 stop:1496 length:171 start_codon:yes stop_codon:yes gene_type:complete
MKDLKKYVTYFLLFLLAYLLSKEIKEGFINFFPGNPLPPGQLPRRKHCRNVPLFYR